MFANVRDADDLTRSCVKPPVRAPIFTLPQVVINVTLMQFLRLVATGDCSITLARVNSYGAACCSTMRELLHVPHECT